MIADRVIVAHVDWVDDESLDFHRAYRGFRAADDHLNWSGDVRRLADEHSVTAPGFFNGLPGLPDSHLARLALLLLLRKSPDPPAAVLLIRDSDNDPNRKDGEGLKQARDAVQPLAPFPIVTGVAHTKRECWVLAGFVSENGEESARLEEARKRLGYNPCEASHRLGAEANKGTHNAKSVLRELTQNDRERELRCLSAASLDTLRKRGGENGLVAYLDELEQHILPLFGARPTG